MPAERGLLREILTVRRDDPWHRLKAGRKRVRRERWQQRKTEPKAAPEN
jgi:hypothetical protein